MNIGDLVWWRDDVESGRYNNLRETALEIFEVCPDGVIGIRNADGTEVYQLAEQWEVVVPVDERIAEMFMGDR